MPKASKKRKPGRPALPPERRKTSNLTFRVRGDLREQLQTAAAISERSISEEVEQRLQNSFLQEPANKLLAEVQELLDEARRIREEAISEIAEIKKAVLAGRPPAEIFPANALVTTKYGTHVHLREMNK